MTPMPRSRSPRPSPTARPAIPRTAALGLALLALLALAAGSVALAQEATEAPAADTMPAAQTMPAQATPSGQPASEPIHGAPADRPHVALARFTTAIENREPVDSVAFLSTDVHQIFFYTDLRDLEGQTITHRWEYKGVVKAEVPFEVGGPRWRVWSSKQLLPELIGDWTVSVVKQDGEVLASETFTYSPIQPGA